MKIAIGTENPTKVNAVKNALGYLDADFYPIAVSSDVSSQPFSDKETIIGAINRAKNAKNQIGAQIGIGLEGGVEENEFGLFLCNWGALVDEKDTVFIAGGARILLPNEVVLGLKSGKELADVMDEYTSRHNVRSKEGAIGIFSNGHINRTDMFTSLVKLLIGQYEYSK
ncbi:DUF84 family protein [Bacillus timonensis]|nr:DUF84 family protein [Bacillus timonensis]